MIRSAAGISGLGTILGVWAHPDDEAYLSGGLMALARDAGSRVVCVTATRGELGTPDPATWPPDRLAMERTGELARSLKILGVDEHHWLGYRDGDCAQVSVPDAVGKLCALIAEISPQAVLTFGPDGQTGHPDHRAISAWTTQAFDRAAARGSRLLYSAVTDEWMRRWSALNERFGIFAPGYPVTTPTSRLAVNLRLDEATTARKICALRAQVTQTSGLVTAMGIDTYRAWVAEEYFTVRYPS
ncbi:MAG TPA: PIG-L family deacetylase [Pseudonocardiaceae bacterium]|nr:PIG-L family deacetylase [Pseudonocardiaceae bacterium]